MPRLASGVSTAVLAALLLCLGAGAARAQVQTRSVESDLRVESSGSEDRRGMGAVQNNAGQQRRRCQQVDGVPHTAVGDEAVSTSHNSHHHTAEQATLDSR